MLVTVVIGVPVLPVARQDWDITLVHCCTRHTNRTLFLRGFQLEFFFLLGLGATREAKAKTVSGKGVQVFVRLGSPARLFGLVFTDEGVMYKHC